MRRGEKRTPTIFLVVILFVLAYGFIANAIVTSLPVDSFLLNPLNSINITITCFWFLFNVFLIFFFFKYHYEIEAKGLSIYYVIINGLNLYNVIFQAVTNYHLLFLISLGTKAIELFVVLNLLVRNVKMRR